MARWRLVLIRASGVSLALLLLIGFAAQRTHTWLTEHALSLNWQHAQLTWQGLTLSQVRLEIGQQLQAEAETVHLSWQPWYHVEINRLRLNLTPSPSEAIGDEPASNWQAALNWLPRALNMPEALFTLPCASGQCTQAVSVQLIRKHSAIELSARLPHGESAIALYATLIQDADLAQWQLTARAQLNPQSLIAVSAQLTDEQFSGQLHAPLRGELNELRDWLGQWLLSSPQLLAHTPQHADLHAHWQLPFNASQQAEISAHVQLNQPWPVPELGTVAGSADVQLIRKQGLWQAQRLEAQLSLDPSAARWINETPQGLHPGPLTVTLNAPQANTLDVQLSSQGALRLNAEAQLSLHAQVPLHLSLNQLTLNAASAEIHLSGQRVKHTELSLKMSGSLLGEQLNIELLSNSQLKAESYRFDDLQLQRLSAPLSALTIHGTWAEPSLSGALTLRSAAIDHPALKPQSIQWRTQLLAGLQAQSMSGPLSAASGLSLDLALHNDQNQGLSLEAQWQHDLALSNPLPELLSQWPALLSVDSGQLNAELKLKSPVNQPMILNANLSADNLSGIYDRTSLENIKAKLSASFSQGQLSAQLHTFNAQRIDPGVPLGPTTLQASYKARTQAPLAGELFIEQAQSQVLEGQLQLPATRLNLAHASQLLPLQLTGLNLATLLAHYPAEGLSGSGLIDAHLPLRLASGLSIENGQVQARAPGGVLRFDSEKIRALGKANPAMQVVTQALENFHYSQLSSSLNYSPSGALNLDLRLHGQNPELEQGRAINFTINLEEDVPSLLASVQLSGKVSELIQQRIEHTMRQRAPSLP